MTNHFQQWNYCLVEATPYDGKSPSKKGKMVLPEKLSSEKKFTTKWVDNETTIIPINTPCVISSLWHGFKNL